jgi:hypothetical protein
VGRDIKGVIASRIRDIGGVGRSGGGWGRNEAAVVEVEVERGVVRNASEIIARPSFEMEFVVFLPRSGFVSALHFYISIGFLLRLRVHVDFLYMCLPDPDPVCQFDGISGTSVFPIQWYKWAFSLPS